MYVEDVKDDTDDVIEEKQQENRRRKLVEDQVYSSMNADVDVEDIGFDGERIDNVVSAYDAEKITRIMPKIIFTISAVMKKILLLRQMENITLLSAVHHATKSYMSVCTVTINAALLYARHHVILTTLAIELQ